MAKMTAMDGNTAVAEVAHATNEVIAIYPITPSSVMGELCDIKSAKGQKNIWGSVPNVTEMQSEGGAAGAVHGALTSGALTTTFTASQGLLLMIPNMYKIAGELTPTVFHVSARAIAAQALSIFGDHSDIMACRQTGWAMLAANNPQECADMALVSQAAALESRLPFLHYFDGFRTSHELNMVDVPSMDTMKAMITDELVAAHRKTGLNPEAPTMKGTAQNPDVYFQGRETVNKYYDACPAIVSKAMDKFAKLTGRKYSLFEYVGAKDAERVVVIMCSGAEVAESAVSRLVSEGEKVGVLKIRLFRPFSIAAFADALPKTVKSIAVMDRTKEPGSLGEPLFQDVCTVFADKKVAAAFGGVPAITGGRYGLGSKEFTPAMVKSVFDGLKSGKLPHGFTVGINDDVTNLSLTYDTSWVVEGKDVFRAMFYGLGSDGTVGANKNTMKIISEDTDNMAQGYFVYDSKKAGSMTVSHVRFGKDIIRAPYLISTAQFVGCHLFAFLEKFDITSRVSDGGVFLLNSPHSASEVWSHIPKEDQKNIVDKKLKFYVINASEIAKETGMGGRTNVIMQTAFFAISGVLPKDEAIAAIKNAIKKSYSKKGEEVVKQNFAAVDRTIEALEEVKPGPVNSTITRKPAVPADSPEFVKNVLGMAIANKGDDLPVSAIPPGGVFPTGTSQYEKRNIALESPVWDPEVCIQCGICSLVCPHAAIRIKAYDAASLSGAPKSFKSTEGKTDLKGMKFTVQVAVEDCTGCGACVYNCPAKSKTNPDRKAINLEPQLALRDTEIENFKFFLGIKDTGSSKVKRNSIKGSQLMKPLFEFSGACAGCGETPYVKLLTQLHGDHMTIANATGCSSIYGGNLPTTPYAKRDDGRGPAWSNSLFEDNAEFGMGMRLAYTKLAEEARELLSRMADSGKVDKKLVADLLEAKQNEWQEIEQQRGRVADLKKALSGKKDADCANMLSFADHLVTKSVWILGGDGWAYDIGYGGLDHVLASGKKVRVLVMDTEVYSNTGGQMSKATPMGATAQFAAGGKTLPKKDLGMIAMTYGNIYVANVAMGANYNQVVQAMAEAEAFDGPAIIIAYAHCIAHGIDMRSGMNEAKRAVASGRWILYRFNPALRAQGKNPLTIDSGKPTLSVEEYMKGENRFRGLMTSNPEVAQRLLKMAEAEYAWRMSVYQQLAAMTCDAGQKEKVAAAA